MRDTFCESTMSRTIRQREKSAGKRPAESTSSNSNDGVFQELVKPVKAAKALDEVHSNSLTIWQEAFNLERLPQSISVELIKRAPFLLGAEKAIYTKQFFKTIGGLCAAGIPFESLMKDERGVPLEDLVATYPLNKNGNRHSLRLMTDRDAARNALHMHQRVYGGTHPDNGEVGTNFIRGLVLQYQHETQVNWADFAADLAKKRMDNPLVIPHKLTPPCLREQIQAMINLFDHYLRVAYADREAAIAQLRRANLPIRPSDFTARQRGFVQLMETKPHARKDGHAEAFKASHQGSTCSSETVQQKCTPTQTSLLGITARRVDIDDAELLKPVDPKSALATVQEVLNSLIQKAIHINTTVKRPSEVNNFCGSEPLSKRAHLASDLEQKQDSAATTIHEETCAIGTSCSNT